SSLLSGGPRPPHRFSSANASGLRRRSSRRRRHRCHTSRGLVASLPFSEDRNVFPFIPSGFQFAKSIPDATFRFSLHVVRFAIPFAAAERTDLQSVSSLTPLLGNEALLVCLAWMFFVHGTSCEGCGQDEREALFKLKADLEDPSSFLSSWVGQRDCCTWSRVVCDNFTGHVTELHLGWPSLRDDSVFTGEMTSLDYVNLARNNISGTIPTSFGALAQLSYMDISQNSLHGVVYPEIHFANMRKLTCFYASGNKMVLKAKPDWVPSMVLEELDLESWYVGPGFPNWLQYLQHLKSLDLSNSGISEPIPGWFWSISSQYYYLNFSHNQIPGRLPHVVPIVITISYFDFSFNCLEGPVPAISSNLTFLDLSNNLLSGNLFKFLCFNPSEMRATEFLSLYGNNLTGEIPDCWKTWPSLSSIRLGGNKLSGKIPKSLGYVSSLKSLRLQDNRLSGEIPQSLENCSRLVIVDLSDNGLEGKIPKWMGQSLSRLSILSLRKNKFHGSIPKEICDLQSLQILDLSLNSLSGALPECVANLSAMATPNNNTLGVIAVYGVQGQSLLDTQILVTKGQLLDYSTILNYVRSFDLSWNDLSGQIPNEIFSLAALKYLNLSHNSFSGAIPEDLTAMLSLESMDLSMNLLSRSIPSSLGSLTFLNHLNLSYNNLSGKIPSSTQLQSFDSWSFIGNQELCGPPLNVDCSYDSRLHSLIDGEEIDEEHALYWFFSSVVLGFVGGFWGVVATFAFIQLSTIPDSEFKDYMGKKLDGCNDGGRGCASKRMATNGTIQRFERPIWCPETKDVIKNGFWKIAERVYSISFFFGAHFPIIAQLTARAFAVHCFLAPAKLPHQSTSSAHVFFVPSLSFAVSAEFPLMPLLGNEGHVTSSEGCCQDEREALLKFKDDLEDPTSFLSSWVGQDPCTWSGVVCDNFTGHVTELHLGWPSSRDDSVFSGKLNPSLLQLKYLSYLDLSNNRFQGIPIPSFLGSMSSLKHLYLDGAGFGGVIPHQLGNLSNLHQLGLQAARRNVLYADSLKWLSGMSSLRYLDLSDVDLSDASDWLNMINTLPSLSELYLSNCRIRHIPPLNNLNMSSLSALSLQQNDFDQTSVPSWVFHLQSLTYLNLGINSFDGPISDELQNLTSLRTLSLNSNRFNHSIPNWLYRFSHLETLDLYGNHLDGKVSTAGIGNLSSLVDLNLSVNHGLEFERGIPESFKSFCRLRSLSLQNVKLNQKVSELLEILGECASDTLQVLLLFNCQLSGQLTSRIGNFKKLYRLILGNNSISGSLPMSFGEMTSLIDVDLSRNNISGTIPTSFGELAQLAYVDISQNSLHGVVYPEIHFANLRKLSCFYASGNKMVMKAKPDWVPYKLLEDLDLESWYVGPGFPHWLKSLQYLKSLDLSNSRISEPIPDWFWSISSQFYYLNFSRNQIPGRLPHVIPVVLTVSYFDFSSNFLEGPLPAISSNLTFVDLSNNLLSGNLFKFLCFNPSEMRATEFLSLYGNNLTGEIPDCWKTWPSLSSIRLGGNKLSGKIPKSLGYVSSLVSLRLQNNRLSGQIPPSLQNCSRLVIVDLSDNGLEGKIPEWMGQSLSRLSILSLRRNKFHGSIPKEICGLQSLQILDLSHNSLSGALPECVANLSAMATPNNNTLGVIAVYGVRGQSLLDTQILVRKGQLLDYSTILNYVRSLDLSWNDLSGQIPNEISSLAALKYLNLSHNSFSGAIPKDLTAMLSLESMDLSMNQLSGSIPSTLGSLTFLNYLNLSYNNLVGKIPSSTQLQSFDSWSFIGNQELCGPPLNVDCSNDSKVPGLMDGEENDGEHALYWFSGSVALGFVGGFWGVVATFAFIQLSTNPESEFKDHTVPAKQERCSLKRALLICLGCVCFGRATSSEGCDQDEREALLKFKADLEDPSSSLSSWVVQRDCCIWSGVVCDNFTGHVTELHLGWSSSWDGSVFSGKLNSQLLQLKYLSYLDLSNNHFKGIPIPSFLGSMSSLKHLYLDGSGFGGVIPHQLGNLTNLKQLGLQAARDYVLYADSLRWLSGLSSLRYLDLSDVDLSNASDWLSMINTLPTLSELYLSNCRIRYIPPLKNLNMSLLSGLSLYHNQFAQTSVPSWVFHLRSLTYLDLGVNTFDGPIPDQLQNLTSLRTLSLSGNRFNHPIPDWLYRLSHLEALYLCGNKLDGKVSTAGIGNLSSLVYLDISDNYGLEFERGIPESFKSFCHLRSLSLNNVILNQNVSELLEILGECASDTLQALLLFNSQLCGQLTDRIGDFKRLSRLDLRKNSISGSLPMSFGEMTSLYYLNLARNKISGTIPTSFGALAQLNYVDISQNSLHGVIYPEIHFANLRNLACFYASGNQMVLKAKPDWVPSKLLDELDLESCYVGPVFPHWLRSLQHLKSLDLSNSGISEPIPDWFWSMSSQFYYLNFSHNQIPGRLSHVIPVVSTYSLVDFSFNCLEGALPTISSNLTFLDLSSNLLSGNLFKFFCFNPSEMRATEFLNLFGNRLTGEIPDCWKTWQSLSIMRLDRNKLSGKIPRSLGYLSSLRSLRLQNNRLSGEIPPSLQNCSRLVTVDLGHNGFEGKIPEWMGQRLSRLSILSLPGNKFHGSIPKEICNLQSLQILDLSHNSLSGILPKCIANLSAMATPNNDTSGLISPFAGAWKSFSDSLILTRNGQLLDYSTILNYVRSLDLSSNNLSGRIPNQITSLVAIQYLNLSHNSFSGAIPEDLTAMLSLESMDLSTNQLSGSIPSTLGSLTFLNCLNLSYNNLVGKIPSSTQLQSFDSWSFIGNQELCGPPLNAADCSNDSRAPGLMDGEENDEEHALHWFSGSVVFGFVAGFWGVIVTLAFVGPTVTNPRI
ncbi:unnamed protein product, partial [Linum tenue]